MQSQLIEQTTRHQVFLERVKTGEANQFAAFLRDIDRSLRLRLSVDVTEYQRDRMERLLTVVESDLNAIYDAHWQELSGRLIEIGDYEAGFEARSVTAVVDDFEAVVPAPEQVRAAVFAAPLSVRGPDGGKLLESFVRDWSAIEVKRVSGAIRQGFFEGQTTSKILQTVRGTRANQYRDGLLAISNRNAEAVVRTALQHTASVARQETWKQNSNVVIGVRWVSTLDGRTTQICRSLDGTVYPVDKGPRPPIHVNCLPGDAHVLARSGIAGASKRWFEGEVVIVRTANDRELTCTPNHPILTSKGWIAASLLDETCCVVCDGGREWVVSGDGDYQCRPAKIQDVAKAFFRESDVISVPMPVTAPDFHGDGAGSDVAVIGANRCLKPDVYAALAQHLGQRNLIFVNVRQSMLSGLRAAGQFGGGMFATAHGVMRLGGIAAPLVGACASHPGSLLSGSVADRYFGLVEDAIDHVRRHAEMRGDRADANAGIVNLLGRVNGDFVARLRGRCAGIDPMFFQNTVDGGFVEAKLASDLVNGKAGAVFLDNVISVSKRSFAGHVFNLETGNGVYSANGIVTHNCRSTTVAELDSRFDFLKKGATRSSKDGYVPGNLTYYDWLLRQPAGFQDQAVGPTRGKLLRNGGLTAERFAELNLGKNFNPLTLKEMRGLEPLAFERAGL